MVKTCTRCGFIKDVSQFYKHTAMKDGYLNQCISCKLSQTKEYREKNIERIRQYDRKRSYSEVSKERRRKYIENMKANNPELYRQMRKKTINKNRIVHAEKYKAWGILNHALQAGNIKKANLCERCSDNSRLEAHHYDYSKPLDVIWLCDNCHKQIHVEIREKSRNMA